MADPVAPGLFFRLISFMRESDEWGTPADVLRSAEDAGLAIVSQADRKVLEACAALAPETLEAWVDIGRPHCQVIARAELTRRRG